ncbi:MAG TPA: sigma-70 family RNA polymerase sigma factor [Polyangiaceae bacterium]|nr:sigma-70 family RNA polymerase sigma factor [Polyangiaceae bacterium]
MPVRNSLAPAQRASEPAEPSASLALPSFAVVYRSYFDFVWSSTRHLGIDRDAIDDVVQEVFIVIHARLHTVQQPESLRSWIYGVVRRTVSRHRRARKVRDNTRADWAELDSAAAATTTMTPLEQHERDDNLALLSSLLNQLDEAKREVFFLAELEEMTAPEIAQALEIPLNTVYSRLRAARLAFDAALARHTAKLTGTRRS